jgi:hypothetical protein
LERLMDEPWRRFLFLYYLQIDLHISSFWIDFS